MNLSYDPYFPTVLTLCRTGPGNETEKKNGMYLSMKLEGGIRIISLPCFLTQYRWTWNFERVAVNLFWHCSRFLAQSHDTKALHYRKELYSCRHGLTWLRSQKAQPQTNTGWCSLLCIFYVFSSHIWVRYRHTVWLGGLLYPVLRDVTYVLGQVAFPYLSLGRGLYHNINCPDHKQDLLRKHVFQVTQDFIFL